MRMPFQAEARIVDAVITPNDNGLPGVAEARRIVGALLTFGLIAAVAGIAVSAIVWALASNSANPHMAGRGKQGVLVSAACALLIGGADTIVTFFQSAGHTI
jgi:hypothetical protein